MSGFFWITIKDKNRQDDPKIGVVKFSLDNLKPFQPIFVETKLNASGQAAQDGDPA